MAPISERQQLLRDLETMLSQTLSFLAAQELTIADIEAEMDVSGSDCTSLASELSAQDLQQQQYRALVTLIYYTHQLVYNSRYLDRSGRPRMKHLQPSLFDVTLNFHDESWFKRKVGWSVYPMGGPPTLD